jgi:hypothetical protein
MKIMKDLSWAWLLAGPLLIPFCLISVISDVFETPRSVREEASLTEIVHACDEGDLTEVHDLLREWQLICPDRNAPREGLVILSSISMSDQKKIAYLKRLIQKEVS